MPWNCRTPPACDTECGNERPMASHSICIGSSPAAVQIMDGFSPGPTVWRVGFNSILGGAEKSRKNYFFTGEFCPF